MSATTEPGRSSGRALWVQCGCTAPVALGADATAAAIWPLIVDGLLTMATVELWKTTGRARRVAGGRRGRRSG
ncbi:hypothetical protein A4R44_07613 [Amycolatopsis sp. M39]|nr:hypothetical protein A4R44_07613 [Amycolatopsis sp. M39]